MVGWCFSDKYNQYYMERIQFMPMYSLASPRDNGSFNLNLWDYLRWALCTATTKRLYAIVLAT